MRLYGITDADVEATVNEPRTHELDERGNARLTGERPQTVGLFLSSWPEMTLSS